MPRPAKPESTLSAASSAEPVGSLDTDTIAAIATAYGQAGIGVIRVSGPHAHAIGEAISGAPMTLRTAMLRKLRDVDGSPLDSGLVLSFAQPNSFTGEDVVEFQAHGGPVLMQMLLRAVLARGARLARPGEFSERAFCNGKIDLAQAEAIADLIAGASEQAVRGANRSLSGEFSRRVHDIETRVSSLRTFVEASIDFAEEDIDLLEEGQVRERLRGIHEALTALRAESAQGVMLRDGVSLALVGEPNVGKSSLLNRLAGEQRAIVTDVPGTTRDLVRVDLNLDGLPIEIVDTAGLRDTDDVVESAGVQLARQQAARADVVLLLRDARLHPKAPSAEELDVDPARIIVVVNKVDLTDLGPGRVDTAGNDCQIRVSALTGAGIPALRESIRSVVGYQAGGASFTARQRHLDALDAALQSTRLAQSCLEDAIELLAEELRVVHIALGEIVGEMTPDELLGEIFSAFCIGK